MLERFAQVRHICGILAVACVGLGCANGTASRVPARYIVAPRTLGNHRIGVLRLGQGFACEFDRTVAPASYLISDIGRPGVPKLRPRDLAAIDAIQKHVRISTLRFSYVGSEFVVFNAPLPVTSVCSPETPPFAVWTGACNEYYNPLLGVTEAVMDCGHPPRPWIKGDSGHGSGSWANIVH